MDEVLSQDDRWMINMTVGGTDYTCLSPGARLFDRWVPSKESFSPGSLCYCWVHSGVFVLGCNHPILQLDGVK